MNRQEALEWLVANRTSWPKVVSDEAPEGWCWANLFGDIFLWSWNYRPKISASDWLAATDDMPKQDCESVFE